MKKLYAIAIVIIGFCASASAGPTTLRLMVAGYSPDSYARSPGENILYYSSIEANVIAENSAYAVGGSSGIIGQTPTIAMTARRHTDGPIHATPEPGTIALLALGMVGVGTYARKKLNF